MKSKLAVVIELDDQMEKAARESWSILKNRFSIDFISSRSPCPHITIESDLTGEIDLISNLLANVAKKNNPFSISGNGLGIFILDKPLIYIRWTLNKNFFMFKNLLSETLFAAIIQKNINENFSRFNWLAKTSLAFNDITYSVLPEILNEMKSINFYNNMIVKGFSLYKYSEENGEEKITSFKFQKHKTYISCI